MADSEDTEITLGTGKMLALFFGLVALCAVFFGMGFSLGKSSVKSGSDPVSGVATPGGSVPRRSNPTILARRPTLRFIKQWGRKMQTLS